MSKGKFALLSRCAISPVVEIENSITLVEDGKISNIGKQRDFDIPPDFQIIDTGNWTVAPGFIDIHNHGGMGKMVDEGGFETIKVNSIRLVETGCTAWLPTVDSLYGVQQTTKAKKELTQGSKVLGIHMEGPFLTPKGLNDIQGIDYGVEKPSLEKFQGFIDASEGYLKIMGVSVELDGILPIIQELKALGVVPAIAHSTKATYEQFLVGVENGIRHVTHTFNVMTGLHQRKPGVVGGALTCERVTNEIISDGFHVSPVAIDILLRCKGIDHVCIITDNTSVAGLSDGEYELGGAKIIKKDGITRYANSNEGIDHTMAGSEWPMNHNVKFMIDKVGVGLVDAVMMATQNPAKIIGMDDSIGSLAPGKSADLIAMDDELNIHLTMIDGEICFDPHELTIR